jgi:hypothetical protein
VGTVQKTSDGDIYYHPRVQFTTAEGRTVEFTSTFSSQFAPTVGDPVPVRYRPDSPEQAEGGRRHNVDAAGSGWISVRARAAGGRDHRDLARVGSLQWLIPVAADRMTDLVLPAVAPSTVPSNNLRDGPLAMARRWHAGRTAYPYRHRRPGVVPGLSCWFGVEPPAGIEPATPSLPWNHRGTAVQTAVSPGHARPSGPKLSVLFRRSYAFSFRTR